MMMQMMMNKKDIRGREKASKDTEKQHNNCQVILLTPIDRFQFFYLPFHSSCLPLSHRLFAEFISVHFYVDGSKKSDSEDYPMANETFRVSSSVEGDNFRIAVYQRLLPLQVAPLLYFLCRLLQIFDKHHKCTFIGSFDLGAFDLTWASRYYLKEVVNIMYQIGERF